MIIHLGASKFLAVGIARPEAALTGIQSVGEKEVGGDGVWRAPRVFHDPVTRGVEVLVIPTDDPGYGRLHIGVAIPEMTCIVEVEAYWVAANE